MSLDWSFELFMSEVKVLNAKGLKIVHGAG